MRQSSPTLYLFLLRQGLDWTQQSIREPATPFRLTALRGGPWWIMLDDSPGSLTTVRGRGFVLSTDADVSPGGNFPKKPPFTKGFAKTRGYYERVPHNTGIFDITKGSGPSRG
jgi:hypothetical protein